MCTLWNYIVQYSSAVDYVRNISSICQENQCISNRSGLAGPLNCSNNYYYNNDLRSCVTECGWVPQGIQPYIILANVLASLAILFPLLYFIVAFTLQRQWWVSLTVSIQVTHQFSLPGCSIHLSTTFSWILTYSSLVSFEVIIFDLQQ